MAKSYIKDQIIRHNPANPEIAGGNIADLLNTVIGTEPNLESLPVETNIPAEAYEIAQNDDGAISFTVLDGSALKQVVAVAMWSDMATIPQAEGEPLKSLEKLYIINLPSIDDMRADGKLREWLTSTLERATIAAARKIAKGTHAGKEGYALVNDPVGQFLAAQTSDASRERAFNALFPVMQAQLVMQGAKLAERLAAAGRKGDAAAVKATWAKARLSKETLRAVLSSHVSADFYFPGMTNKDEEKGAPGLAFDKFLSRFVDYAPRHKRAVAVKDAEGNPVKEIVDGKERNRKEMVAAPVDPAILVHWLNTRYDTSSAPEAAGLEVSLDIEAMQLG